MVQSGLSIPNLFSSILGSEHLFFIHYHIIRTLVTVSVHACLPIGYYIFMGLFSSELRLFHLNEINIYWKIYLNFSILFTVLLFSIVYYWKVNSFVNHPIVLKLKKYTSNNSTTWNTIANQINIEFRRVDKFQTGGLFNRVYVTDNWLIKCNLYTIDICKNDDLELTLTHANEIHLTQDGSPSAQYLHILVKSTNNKQKPFYIKLNSLEYKDFNDKLNKPIREATDIIIKQSLPEQFLDAFRFQISENAKIDLKREDVETCVGCMRKQADVKLIKNCDGDCVQCFCRPMWCLECLGKWFAYRQDQSK